MLMPHGLCRSVFVYMYVCMYVCIRVCARCGHRYGGARHMLLWHSLCRGVCVCVCIYVCVCKFIWVSKEVSSTHTMKLITCILHGLSSNVCVFIYMYMRVHTCVCTHTCTHAHTRPNTIKPNTQVVVACICAAQSGEVRQSKTRMNMHT